MIIGLWQVLLCKACLGVSSRQNVDRMTFSWTTHMLLAWVAKQKLKLACTHFEGVDLHIHLVVFHLTSNHWCVLLEKSVILSKINKIHLLAPKLGASTYFSLWIQLKSIYYNKKKSSTRTTHIRGNVTNKSAITWDFQDIQKPLFLKHQKHLFSKPSRL